MPTKLILDTDIGSDIDDAVCLAYLLAQPECDLLGVTTVSGEPELRARMVSAVCRVAGRAVPVYPGAEAPLAVAPRQPRCPQAAALERWPHDTQFPQGQALDFLRQTIRANPGEVVLLAIGPLTNLAQLFQADPQIPSLLKALVLMGGVFVERPEQPEWNIYCDPHAAGVVYRAAAPIHRSVGLDVTRRVQLEAAECRERFRVPLLSPVLDFAEVWFERRPEITFHDPLAAATIFDQQLCRFMPGTVEVSLEEGSAAVTRWRPGAPGAPHEVALEVDAPRFFDHYFGVVGEAGG
jgi:inosine-uridine nucleoside N-ribohydrolase